MKHNPKFFFFFSAWHLYLALMLFMSPHQYAPLQNAIAEQKKQFLVETIQMLLLHIYASLSLEVILFLLHVILSTICHFPPTSLSHSLHYHLSTQCYIFSFGLSL